MGDAGGRVTVTEVNGGYYANWRYRGSVCEGWGDTPGEALRHLADLIDDVEREKYLDDEGEDVDRGDGEYE